MCLALYELLERPQQVEDRAKPTNYYACYLSVQACAHSSEGSFEYYDPKQVNEGVERRRLFRACVLDTGHCMSLSKDRGATVLT